MSKYLLSLDQKEFLVKTPLIEAVLDDQNSTFSANVTKRVVHLGYVDFVLGLQKIPLTSCNIAEVYIRDTPLFDFSILKEDDFHDENTTFSFIAPKTNQQNVIIEPINAFPLSIISDALIDIHYRSITISSPIDFTDYDNFHLVGENGFIFAILFNRDPKNIYSSVIGGYRQTFIIANQNITGVPVRLATTVGSILSNNYTPLKPEIGLNDFSYKYAVQSVTLNVDAVNNRIVIKTPYSIEQNSLLGAAYYINNVYIEDVDLTRDDPNGDGLYLYYYIDYDKTLGNSGTISIKGVPFGDGVLYNYSKDFQF